MIDLFKPTPTDLSMDYLYTIFGNMHGVIVSTQSPEGAAPTISMLSRMFGTLNSIVLTVGVLMIVYVTVVGVMATAHEGEFMGKKWNNMWIPIRTVLGVGLLVPTSSGYSSIQIIMMWFIVQGVGAADSVWNTMLEAKQELGSPFAKITAPAADVSSASAMSGLFQGVVCTQSSAKKDIIYDPDRDGDNEKFPYYFCGDPINKNNPFCTNAGSRYPDEARLKKQYAFGFGPEKACGQVTICDYHAICEMAGTEVSHKESFFHKTQTTTAGTKNATACAICERQVKLVAESIEVFKGIADLFVQADYLYTHFYYSSYIPKDELKAINRFENGIMPRADECEVDEDGDPLPGQDCKSAFSKIIEIAANKAVKDRWNTAARSGSYKFIGDYCTDKNIDTCIGSYLPKPVPGYGFAGPTNKVVTDIYWDYKIKAELASRGEGRGADFMNVIVENYNQNASLDALLQSDETEKADAEVPLEGVLLEAKETGWILAGAYYYTIAKAVSKEMEATIPNFAYGFYRESISEPDNPLSKYRNNFDAAAYLEDAASNADRAAKAGAAQAGRMSQTAANSAGAAFSAGTSDGIGSTDPLQALIITGSVLLWIASILYIWLLIYIPMLAAAASINVIALGTGLSENPFKNSFQMLVWFGLPVILMALGIMTTVGATLSIYVPLVPYVIFATGAVGWMMSTIEAMVAGPLVALGIISPSGQHELLGKAEPAIMLLFNIFMRPTLMIFGMIAAMLLSGVSTHLLNQGFRIFMEETMVKGGGNFSPLALIIFLVVYTMTIITTLNKCFSAIHIIPERVMRWIGGQGESYGESEAVGALKGAVDAGASGASKAAGEMAGAEKDEGKEMIDRTGKSKAAEAKRKSMAEAAAKNKGAGNKGTEIGGKKKGS